ncbi:MAG: toprim domain-containing protein [Treponema sp.]|nr:toprim domain-containing protein [Treponema sp.]
MTNSVAPLGTAFTDEQASWLRRWVDKVILIFDNDEAGQKAAYKAIITCRKNGLSCAIADIQEGLKSEKTGVENANIKDPADILLKFNPEILKNILKFIINDFEYLILRGKSQFIEKMGDVNKATEFIFPYLDVLNSEVDRSDCITRLADFYKIERSAVQKDYLQWKSGGFSRNYHEKPEIVKEQTLKTRIKVTRNAELSLLTVVAVNMELYPDFRSVLEIKDIDDSAAKELFIALEECFKHDESGMNSLLARIDDESLRNYVADRGTSGEFRGDSRKFMEDGINKIRKKKLEKRLTEINAQMREIERRQEGYINIDELLIEKKVIDSQIRKLEGR